MLQFEKNAAAYDNVRKKITYPEDLYRKLASMCENHEHALDIGCGNGVSSIRLKPYFKNVEGIDLGDNLIHYASISYPEIKFSVSKAEDIKSIHKYNLITSATSFYWMKRDEVLRKLQHILVKNGVFCAYKYDFPIVYGKLRDFITYQLATKWLNHRDQRLINYDDTQEIIIQSNIFEHTERFVVSNIIDLSPEEVAYFFLSTSYVTKYIETMNDTNYSKWFIEQCKNIAETDSVKVNFDIHCYLGKQLKEVV